MSTGKPDPSSAVSVTGLSEADDLRDYEFGVLMDIDPSLQQQFDVAARTASSPNRRKSVSPDLNEHLS